MKKVLIFTLSLLLLANIVAAANKPPKVLMATTVGVVKSVDMNNQLFVMERTGLMRFIYAFLGLFKFQRSTNITVITTTETEFKKKTTEGVAGGAFTDLAVGQRVQVKGSYITEQTTTTTTSTSTPTTTTTTPRSKIKATSVFILTPIQMALKKCQTDSDCTWCGNTCVEKNTLKDKMCAQVMPPAGFICQCINNVCQKAPASGVVLITIPTSTANIIDKTCLKACQDKGYTKSVCRQWAVTLKAKMGCNKNEKEIGQTKDCTTVVNGQSLLGIGKTCCCSKENTNTTD